MSADASGLRAQVIVAEKLTQKIVSGGEQIAILDGLSLSITAGETVAIVGASGSGKTTLLSLLAGLDSPTSGSIMLAGQSLSSLDEDGRAALRAGRVGFVFQSFQLLAGLTALENVMLPAELAGRADADKLARETLAKVGLEARTGHYPYQLSGGEQQRVAIARAIASDPEVLLADEPTGNLDTARSIEIMELIAQLNAEEGLTVIMVTHEPDMAEYAKRIIHFKDGLIERDGLNGNVRAPDREAADVR